MRCQCQESDNKGKHEIPQDMGGFPCSFRKFPFRFEAEPQSTVHAENADKKYSACQAVRVEQHQEISMINAVRVNRNTHKKVRKRNAEQQSGHERT